MPPKEKIMKLPLISATVVAAYTVAAAAVICTITL